MSANNDVNNYINKNQNVGKYFMVTDEEYLLRLER